MRRLTWILLLPAAAVATLVLLLAVAWDRQDEAASALSPALQQQLLDQAEAVHESGKPDVRIRSDDVRKVRQVQQKDAADALPAQLFDGPTAEDVELRGCEQVGTVAVPFELATKIANLLSVLGFAYREDGAPELTADHLREAAELQQQLTPLLKGG